MSAGKLVLLCLMLAAPGGIRAADARIIKVLPHLTDRQGRHLLAPSLYERDAYQAHLRRHPELRHGLRFDVQWNAQKGAALTLRLELRGTRNGQPTTAVIHTPVQDRTRLFRQWDAAILDGEEYQRFGDLLAWRATLWQGDKLLAEQRSFLW